MPLMPEDVAQRLRETPAGPLQVPRVSLNPDRRLAEQVELQQWTALLEADLNPAIESLREAIVRMSRPAELAAEGMRQFLTEGEVWLAFGIPESEHDGLFRSPLGAAEDPHDWTTPGRDQMRWAPPETDEEVPRWLA